MARLDVPTFDDPVIQRQLEKAFPPHGRSSIAWDTVTMAMHIFSTIIQVVSQAFVLVGVLRDQRDGLLLALISFAHTLLQWIGMANNIFNAGGEYRVEFDYLFARG